MLIQSPYKEGDVVTLKLINGEEMVTRLEKDETSDITITRPLVLTMNPQSGQPMLVPWLMSVDPTSSTKYKIEKTKIVCIVKTAKDVGDSYTQSTSGIVTATVI